MPVLKDPATSGNAKAKDGAFKDVTTKVAQALGLALNRKLRENSYDKKQACKRLCWMMQQLATSHLHFRAAATSMKTGVLDSVEDLHTECSAVVDDVLANMERKTLTPHEYYKLAQTLASCMGRLSEESSEYYAALTQINLEVRNGEHIEGEFSDAQIKAKIAEMKEAKAWTAAQLGQIKMAGDEAKAAESGPDGADPATVREAKAMAKKAAKRALQRKIAISMLFSEENDIDSQASMSERTALLLKKRVVSDVWHLPGEGDSASASEGVVAAETQTAGAKKRAAADEGPAAAKKPKNKDDSAKEDAEDKA